MARARTANVTALKSPQEKEHIRELRDWFVQNRIRRVRVGGFDIDGLFRGKIISPDKFFSTLEGGFGFCDVIFGWDSADQLIDGLSMTGWHTGYPDTNARIDLDSRRLVPWDPGTALFLADFWDRDHHRPLEVCPRQVLKRVLRRLDEAGLHAKGGFEYEFFLFRETPETMREKNYRNLRALSPGMFGYSVLRASEHADLVNQIFDELTAADIGLEGMHTETGPGVYECAIRYDDALAAADKAALFKTAVKEIAFRHGLVATFMAKWNTELPGCSGHVHLSLWDRAGKNRFHAARGLAEGASGFVGGLVQRMPDITAMFAPTLNSYKRLVPGTWAPVSASWGIENRTTAVRYIPGGPGSTRFEFRAPGADANPYLVMAAALAMGHQGMESGEQPSEPVSANAYEDKAADPLPRSLSEAVARFRRSRHARDAFGDMFVDHFSVTREWEVRAFERSVTDWELSRYFECI